MNNKYLIDSFLDLRNSYKYSNIEFKSTPLVSFEKFNISGILDYKNIKQILSKYITTQQYIIDISCDVGFLDFQLLFDGYKIIASDINNINVYITSMLSKFIGIENLKYLYFDSLQYNSNKYKYIVSLNADDLIIQIGLNEYVNILNNLSINDSIIFIYSNIYKESIIQALKIKYQISYDQEVIIFKRC